MIARSYIVLSMLAASLWALYPALADDDSSVRWPNSRKTASIQGVYRNSRIVVGVSSRTAGAIDSLTWRGMQFVDKNDHGREFQSADVFFNKGECFNPTEAGSDKDGVGQTSTSRLLSISTNSNVLITKQRMAYWIGPGDKSSKCKGTVSTVSLPLSDDVFSKVVEIGVDGFPNIIRYKATFSIPENRKQGGFEVIAGYMPVKFSEFFTFEPATGDLEPLSDGPGKQPTPLIFSTKNHLFALGVYGMRNQSHLVYGPTYARYRFEEPTRTAKTEKWNCAFEEHDVLAGDHTFSCYMIVGTLSDVEHTMVDFINQQKTF